MQHLLNIQLNPAQLYFQTEATEALGDGGGLAEPPEHTRELGGGDGAGAVGVEEAEGVAQVLLDGGRVARDGGVEGGELVEANEAVAVGVRLSHRPPCHP